METTFEQFATLAGLAYSCERISQRSTMDTEWDRSARHFRVTVKRGSKSHSVEFSQGSAHTKDPILADVLYCLQSGCDTESYDGFEDWAECMGYDTDSRKAERIYLACEASRVAMQDLLGSHWDTFLECVEE